jgi:dTMP kinase
MALRPDLTFWLNVKPEIAFDREFKKSQTISYWESGRDMSLSNDLFQSFIRYQSLIRREFDYLSQRHGFIEIDGEESVSEVNRVLRKRIASALGIRSTHYKPSHALAHLWR